MHFVILLEYLDSCLIVMAHQVWIMIVIFSQWQYGFFFRLILCLDKKLRGKGKERGGNDKKSFPCLFKRNKKGIEKTIFLPNIYNSGKILPSTKLRELIPLIPILRNPSPPKIFIQRKYIPPFPLFSISFIQTKCKCLFNCLYCVLFVWWITNF